MIVRLLILALVAVGEVTVPCSDTPPPPTFVGPPLPTCAPTAEMLQDLELLRDLELLESWEILGE